MKLLVLSDSHGKTGLIYRLLESLHTELDYVIHLGDCFTDIDCYTTVFTDINFVMVTGNCDYCCKEIPYRIITVEGVKIFITHGHHYRVKSGLYTLLNAAKENNADLCLFGHTHRPETDTISDVLFINPGSLSLPRDGSKAGYALIHIESGKIIPKFITLD